MRKDNRTRQKILLNGRRRDFKKLRVLKSSLFTAIIVVSLFSITSKLVWTGVAPQPEQAPVVDFNWRPRFIIAGEIVNFTAIISGGTPPYTNEWDFNDSQTGTGYSILHSFTAAGTYLVKLNSTDSGGSGLSTVATKSVVVNDWPVARYGWVVRWNLTASDGINIWDVSYQGNIVVRDARLAAVKVTYRDNVCGPFYDEPQPSATQRVKDDGFILYEDSPDPLNPFFQIRATYDVPGYFYQEVFRFYPDGRWEPELQIGRGGCAIDHTYEPRWRIDLSVFDDASDYTGHYTPSGTWRSLLWEGSYTDNGFRDPGHNGTEWRFGDQRRLYYIVPKLVRADLELPDLPSRILLVRARASEIETPGSIPHPCSVSACETPVQYVNGELAFRRNIALWFMPIFWDHGPVSAAPSKVSTLTFYPSNG